MPELRVLDRITRQIQRLGYLKRLLRRVTATSTSNLENLGLDLIDTVTRKVRVELNEDRVKYIKLRLYDRTYDALKKQVNSWQNGNITAESSIVSMELQDLYLADRNLPSGVGKLVKDDWDIYPTFGVSIGFIRAGTYSATTRASSLLYFTLEDEQKSFQEYLPAFNPFRLSQSQAILLLYSLIDNDGEVVAPLWQQLKKNETFNDREAGDLLPEIYQAIVIRNRNRILSVEMRERLIVLEKSSQSILRQRGKERYAGGSSREHASRPRLEPYVDIGIFSKPEQLRYEYSFSPAGIKWTEALSEINTSQDVSEFLENRFFSTCAIAFGREGSPLSDPDKVVPHLHNAWKNISGPGGYAPIEELALVAGIEALVNNQLIIEPAVARQVLIDYQKANPYHVRFTVDRMGVLAHARFLEPPDAMQQ